ncbi:MAG: tetratricopeptide repeat protein [Candidatus Riflebacteria bacterium]|nr:tetratricopeptide repeat protein [Candidatus Riflebacteria bacterium]
MNRHPSPRILSPLRTPGLLLTVPLLAAALLLPAAGASRKPKAAGPVIGIQEQKINRVSGKHLTKARSLREKGKNDLAIAEYRQALTIDPSSAEAALELGDLYFQLEIFPQCAEILEAGLPLAEQQGYDARVLGQAWCRLARCHLANGAPEPAATALLKAAALIPDDPEPHAVLGDLQGARDRFDEAFNAYRRAVRADPQYTAAWTAMGDLAVRAGRAREASEALAGLAQADSQAAARLRQAMAKAKIDPVPVPPPAPPAATPDPYADQPAPAAAATPANAGTTGKEAPTADNPAGEGDDDEASSDPNEEEEAPPAGPATPTTAKTTPHATTPTPEEDDPYGEVSPRATAAPGNQTGPTGTARTTGQNAQAGAPPASPNKVLPPVYKNPPPPRPTAAGSAAPTTAASLTPAGNPTAGPASGAAGSEPGNRRLPRPVTPSEPVPLPPDPTKANASQGSPIPPSPTPKTAQTTASLASTPTPAPTPKATQVTGAGSPPAKGHDRLPAAGGPAAGVPAADPTAPTAPTVSPAQVADAVARFASDDEAVAEQGRQAVLALGAPAVPALAGKLADPDPNLRRRTLRVLAEFGETAKPAFDAVEEALADPDPGVVEAAQEALDRIGGN